MSKYYGRKQIFTSVEEFTRDNIIEVLQKAVRVHKQNVTEMDYLYNVYKGKQDIEDRKKTLNSYILYQICENRAKEIVDFKTSFLVGDAIKYSAVEDDYADAVDTLNDFCRTEGKESVDYDLIEWFNICGTAYRMILPKAEKVEDESPFEVYSLDPRTAFVAYSSKVGHKPVLSCYYTTDDNKITTYSVYAHNPNGNVFFEIVDREITRFETWTLPTLPIIEYPHGKSRMGAFEPVLDLLNALNTLDSNRLESIEQFVQSLLVLTNCKLPDEFDANSIKEMGLIELISTAENKASITQIANTLDQTNTQTLKEDMLQAIRQIVSMPNVTSSNTSGDNGLAVLYRNGWEGAYESAMKDQKNIDFSEHQSIKLMLEICEGTNTFSLPLKAVNIDYTRQHYENMATKSQVLIAMLNNDKIHPRTAFEVCGLFYDPNKKYLEGQEWYEQNKGEVTPIEENSTETQTTEV